MNYLFTDLSVCVDRVWVENVVGGVATVFHVDSGITNKVDVESLGLLPDDMWKKYSPAALLCVLLETEESGRNVLPLPIYEYGN